MPPNPRRTAPSSRPPAPLRREDATLGDEALPPDERPRSRSRVDSQTHSSQAQSGCELELPRVGIGAGARFGGVGLGIRNVG